MNDFWKWMEEKGYGEYDPPVGLSEGTGWMVDSKEPDVFFIEATYQGLIGYMMEYLREVKGKVILNTGGRATIEDVYERYVKDIEKIERENLLKRMAGDE